MHIELFEEGGKLYSRTVAEARIVLDELCPDSEDSPPMLREPCKTCDYGNVPEFIYCAACGAHWEE